MAFDIPKILRTEKNNIIDAVAGKINNSKINEARKSFTSDLMASIGKAGGVARQNKYKVFIDAKGLAVQSANISRKQQIVDEESTDWMTDFADLKVDDETIALTAFCDKTELPGYQFQMETQRIYGPGYKVPHMPEFQDLTMTFMCGAEMNEKYFFDSWMYMVMNPCSNNFNYISEYCSNIVIAMYDESGESTLPGGKLGTAAGILNAFSGANVALTWANTIIKRFFKLTVPTIYYVTLVDAFPIAMSPLELGYDLDNTIQKMQVTFTYKYAIPFTGKGSTSGIDKRGSPETFDITVAGEGE